MSRKSKRAANDLSSLLEEIESLYQVIPPEQTVLGKHLQAAVKADIRRDAKAFADAPLDRLKTLDLHVQDFRKSLIRLICKKQRQKDARMARIFQERSS